MPPPRFPLLGPTLPGLLLLGAASLITPAAPAEPVAEQAGATALTAPPLAFERFTLANGLEVIVHQDGSLPLVAVNLWYHVGPASEPPGRSGFAHLFEHLMFSGSRHVGNRFDELMEAAGATNVNGTTSWDRTAYFSTVPREYLERVLWIESDRMGFLIPALDAQALAIQQGVVANERRESYENSPYGPSTLAFYDALFPVGHPYHGAIIGSATDVARATLADVVRFHQTYYSPANATLTIAGDVEPSTVRRLVTRYFGTISGGRPPPRPKATTGRLPGPVRRSVTENVELTRVSFGWIAPPAFGPDAAALEVTMAILAGGRATRLYRALVAEGGLATDVNAYVDANELASIVSVSATGKHGVTATVLESRLEAALAKLGDAGPSAAELRRAQRRILVDLYTDLQQLDGGDGESGRAGILQRFNHYLHDPGYLDRYVASLRAVTAADVARVVSDYLASTSRATVITVPSQQGSEASP